MSLAADIRLARISDVPGLGAIERAAESLFPPSRLPDPNSSFPIPLLEQAVAAELLFVAEVGDTVVGFATCTQQGDRLHLDELAVHPDHGRQGLGRRLVQTVVTVADQQGLVGVSLTTFADIPWNGPFYASMGFETLPEDDLDEVLDERLAHEHEIGLTRRIAMFRSGERGTP